MLAQDYILMNEKKWFLMEHEEYGTRAAYVILSEDGAVVMNDCYNGFDEEARRNIQNFMQQQAAKEQEQQRQQQVQSQKQPNQTQQSLEQQKKKPELANWQKVMDNGEYLRSAEMAEEANYNMIDGPDEQYANEKKLLPRIGSLIESPGFYPNLTGTENLRIFATLRGVPNNHAIKDALDLVGLPYKDKKLFSQYSLGMKQRLAIALAVMHDPELLILDEPINGLDPIGIAEVRSFIRELCDTRGKTILISSHILSEISLLADDIGIIDHGALLEEESLAELEQKSSKHIRFTLSDTAQAARILERNFHETHFSIQDDHNLRLHNMELPVGKIVTAFVENGLEVSEAHTCEESLEDYFKRVTGGEGIA